MGDSMYDGTLPQSDCFASGAYPQAIFTSETIVANRDAHQDYKLLGYWVTGLLGYRSINP